MDTPAVQLERERNTRAIANRLAALGHGPIRHTVQVTSFGGSGTTSVCDHLLVAGVDLPTTRDCFPFKHMRFPPFPQDVPSGFRVVYLCGDPRNAVLSLCRRWSLETSYGFLHLQQPPEETRARLATLEAFLEAGVDELQLEDHVDRWLQRERPSYPVLFVRFELLAEAWPRVCEFVGLPPEHPPIEVKDRSSDWRSLPQPLRSQIDRLYGDLARRIEGWPAAQIN
jgi:sulfotransferase family protein